MEQFINIIFIFILSIPIIALIIYLLLLISIKITANRLKKDIPLIQKRIEENRKNIIKNEKYIKRLMEEKEFNLSQVGINAHYTVSSLCNELGIVVED